MSESSDGGNFPVLRQNPPRPRVLQSSPLLRLSTPSPEPQRFLPPHEVFPDACPSRLLLLFALSFFSSSLLKITPPVTIRYPKRGKSKGGWTFQTIPTTCGYHYAVHQWSAAVSKSQPAQPTTSFRPSWLFYCCHCYYYHRTQCATIVFMFIVCSVYREDTNTTVSRYLMRSKTYLRLFSLALI